MYFTVFTPTYNRGCILKKLFDSLGKQTFTDFEWIVVDDGSTDNTAQIIADMKNENVFFPIRYFKKNNGGKHTAINYGVERAKGKFFFIVDSDDFLTPNALEIIYKYTKQIENFSMYAGVAGLRGDENQKPWITWGTGTGSKKYNKYLDPRQYEFIDATSFQYRYTYKISGDRAEVVKTEVLRNHPFPAYQGENFMSEGVLWSELAHEGYKFRWFNEVIYITEEYRHDGLTQNIKMVHTRNPKGVLFYDNKLQGYKELPYLVRLRAGVGYYSVGMQVDCSLIKLISKSAWKIAAVPCVLLAFMKKIAELVEQKRRNRHE